MSIKGFCETLEGQIWKPRFKARGLLIKYSGGTCLLHDSRLVVDVVVVVDEDDGVPLRRELCVADLEGLVTVLVRGRAERDHRHAVTSALLQRHYRVLAD